MQRSTRRLSHASPWEHSLFASLVESCLAPADVRSWPPTGTEVAARTWERQNVAPAKKHKTEDRSSAAYVGRLLVAQAHSVEHHAGSANT
jgi:hypothetical protein